LHRLWAEVRQRLEAAARLLPNPVRSGDDGGTLAAFYDWLEHNELELAFDELEMLGEANDVPDDYWLQLAAAARAMKLEAGEARCRSRVRGAVQ
ncbi:MAG TPA: hypothetical protein VJ725_29055, partial [Thermoanaerobaculia bacterium]|nr:hypothetical protein [Thermoanaerobaculia bacterium]